MISTTGSSAGLPWGRRVWNVAFMGDSQLPHGMIGLCRSVARELQETALVIRVRSDSSNPAWPADASALTLPSQPALASK